MKGDLPKGHHSDGPIWIDWVCLALIVAWGLAWQAPNLAHPTIRNWDEAFHQAAARGTYDSFFEPHIYAEHLSPQRLEDWWVSTIWLHKPTGPFWFAAAVMHVIGVTPVALRLAGLLGQLGAAVALFLMIRRTTGAFWALVAALGFLALPFGWRLTQGFHFGDVTDATLVGWVSLSMLLLLRAAERPSWRWSLAAGAATGVAFLCKTALALVPLGTIWVLCALAAVKFCRGPRVRDAASFTVAAIAVAAPWNVYTALKWPEIFRAESGHTLAHLSEKGAYQIGPWDRPWDAVLNELLMTELSPLPQGFAVFAALYLAWRAVRRRELPIVAAAIWLWATWFIHSMTLIKVPAQVWNALPAVFIAFAAVGSDLWRSPALAGGTLGSLAAPWLMPRLDLLRAGREALPPLFEQTRTVPGLFEGLVLAAAGAVLAVATVALLRIDPQGRAVPPLRASAVRVAWVMAAPVLLFVWLLIRVPQAQAALVTELFPETLISHSAELGRALDPAIPERSVLFQDVDMDPEGVFEVQSLMFWSGRIAYRGAPDLPAARAKGLHPYLVSPASEPYAPVPGVPAHAWLRAYDLDAPLDAPAPLPEGVNPLDLPLGPARLVGWASGQIDGDHDRYAFYVRPEGAAPSFLLTFQLRDGTELKRPVHPEANLWRRHRSARSAWYLVPAVGPRREAVRAILLGQQRIELGR